jgi:hypothetical protein
MDASRAGGALVLLIKNDWNGLMEFGRFESWGGASCFERSRFREMELVLGCATFELRSFEKHRQ